MQTLAKPRSILRAFLKSEAAGGFLLIAAAAVAMVIANSRWADGYYHFLHMQISPALSPKIGPMTPHLWINDALMALFFMLVGLEIKREWVDGHLATWRDRRLPIIAAVAGMAMPALIYLAVTRADPALIRGWAIPAATDIAFAIAILALLGRRVPTALKLFLITVAIVDDMGAVAIIAIGYTEAISGPALMAALILIALMIGLNRAGVRAVTPYLIVAIFLWYAVLLSGIHATIAGVVAAMTVPVRITKAAPDAADSTLHRIEHLLQKPVAYIIVPLFGFANAGVTLGGVSPTAPLPLAIALGLLIGKQAGIFGSVWIAVKSGFAVKPSGASWAQIYGVALLCGIGFTMSLFIGGLAFSGQAQGESIKIGVLMGSVVSAVLGWVVLRCAKSPLDQPY